MSYRSLHTFAKYNYIGASRFPLMQKMREYFLDFSALNNEEKISMTLTEACRFPPIMEKIMLCGLTDFIADF